MPSDCTYTFDPDDYDETSLTASWDCPHDAVDDSDHCQFHMEASQRAAAGISDRAVVEEFTRLVKEGDPDNRRFIGATLPEISLSYVEIESANQHPIDLRHATISGGLVATDTWFEEQLDLRHSRLDSLTLAECLFEHGIQCAGATITGETDLFETVVMNDDTDFSGVTFAGPVRFDEVDLQKDVSFADAVFEESATFLGAEFYGRSNDINDNTTFAGAVFEGDAGFEHANFDYVAFENVTFTGETSFEKATVTGDCLFTESVFEGGANFNEVRFQHDTSFAGVSFGDAVTFRGVEFEGGAAVLADDISFEGVTFAGTVTFRQGLLGYANFTGAEFDDEADFERATFNDDTIFEDAVFHGLADFDEVVFDGDANFAGVTFHHLAVFRGSEFNGGTDYLGDDAIFEGAVFADDADFRDADFTSASFLDIALEGDVDFTDSEFTDALHLRASSFGDDTYFDFTDAVISDGDIMQPASGWIRFDMTKATLGTVTLQAADPGDERKLLDYFRICDTDFDGFDFADNLQYLDRNNWNLHTFNSSDTDRDFAVEMEPQVIEQTYLKAKNSASAESNIKAAGEFRVKRQQFARQKFFGIARNSATATGARFRNLLRGIENMFLGISCGYGLRLYRITGVFIMFPLLAGILLAFFGGTFATDVGQVSLGDLGTTEGLQTLGTNIYFSYITFLTIGYGDFAPTGTGARFTAGALVYMNVILAGLFLYALIKRSEI